MVTLVFAGVWPEISRFIASSVAMQILRGALWLVSLILAPGIAVLLPQLHRLYGVMLLIVCLVAASVCLLFLPQGRACFGATPAIAAFGAYIFLCDRDVREFQRRRTQRRAPES
jgi:hypothetical protein